MLRRARRARTRSARRRTATAGDRRPSNRAPRARSAARSRQGPRAAAGITCASVRAGASLRSVRLRRARGARAARAAGRPSPRTSTLQRCTRACSTSRPAVRWTLIEGYDAARAALGAARPTSACACYGRSPRRIVSWVRVAAPEPLATRSRGLRRHDLRRDGHVLVEIEELRDAQAHPARCFTRHDARRRARDRAAPQAHGTRALAGRALLPRDLRARHPRDEGVEALLRVLAGAEGGSVLVSAPSTLEPLARQAERAAPREIETPSASSSVPSSRATTRRRATTSRRTLVGFWEELLGVDRVGVHDNFFDLGGHSLIAVRLFAKIKKTWGVDFPISVLFEAPTIESCARAARRRRELGAGRGERRRTGAAARRRRAASWSRCTAARAGRQDRRSSWSPACSATC